MASRAAERLPVWKKVTAASTRRCKRLLLGSVVVVGVLLVLAGIAAYRGGWWTQVLDWAVVAIPGIAGFAAWFLPVKEPTNYHRKWLGAAGIALSGLIWLQQWETNDTHKKEIARLATKEDIAKLPTVQQIGIEFRKATAEQTTTPRVAEAKKSASDSSPSSVAQLPAIPEKPTTASEASAPSEQVVRGIQDIKRLLGSQQWGLSADQLVILSRRMAPFASLINGWSSSGGDLITSVLGNPDSNKFATSLIASLRSAGWNLPGGGMSLAMFNGNPQGVIFVLHSKDDAGLPVLNQFAATLKEAGVDYHGELQDGVPAGQFRIVVGAKPDSSLPPQ